MPRVLEKYNMKDLGSARAIKILMQENASLKNALPTAHILTTSTQLTDSAEDLPIEHVKIKGATSQQQYEGYNLLPNNATTTTVNGIIFTVNADGSVTINGTSTGVAYINLFLSTTESIITDTTKTYTYSKGVANSNIVIAIYEVINSEWVAKKYVISESTTYTPSGEQTGQMFRILVENGKTINNVTVYPMVVEGTSVGDYEPYTGGQPAPNPAYPQLIHRVTGECNEKFVNRNLLPINATSQTINGVTFTVKEDGAIVANGTATNNINYIIAQHLTMELGTFTLSGCPAGGSFSTYYLGLALLGSYTFYVDTGNGQTKTYTNFDYDNTNTTYRIFVANGVVCNNLTFKPMFEKSSTASDYTHHAGQNAPLSLGNEEYYEGDEIQISYVQKAGYKKVIGANIVKNMGKVVLDGSENWTLATEKIITQVFLLAGTMSNASSVGDCLSNYFKNNVSGDAEKIAIGYGNLYVAINKTTASTVEDFKTWLSTHNTEIVYKLATPVTTEITDQTLLAQLETLINMKTYKEVTNIDLTGEDLAPVLDCDYYKSISSLEDRIEILEAQVALLEE